MFAVIDFHLVTDAIINQTVKWFSCEAISTITKQQLAKCCTLLVYTPPTIYLMHLKFDVFSAISAQQTQCIVRFSFFRSRSTRLWKSWIRLRYPVSAFTTFIFSCWKRTWKVLRDFCTLSPSMLVCFITLKRNSNLYYSITTQTGQPPKGFGLEIMSEPAGRLWTSISSSLIPVAVQILILIVGLLSLL